MPVQGDGQYWEFVEAVKVDTISERTAAAGVTIDGVTLKDGGLVLADAATIEVDTVNEATAAAGVTVDGTLLKDGSAMPIIADPGTGAAIPVTRSGVVAITTAAAETNTLAIPTAVGQRLILCCDVYAVGDRVVTAASAINVAGNTIMTFGAARDCIELVGIQLGGALAWEVVWNNGVALS